MEMCHYISTEEKQSPFSYLLGDQECSSATHSVFGNVPLGTTLGSQLKNKTTYAFYKPDSYVTIPRDQQAQAVNIGFSKNLGTVFSAYSKSFLPPQ